VAELDVADDLDVSGIARAQSILVREPEVVRLQWFRSSPWPRRYSPGIVPSGCHRSG
jgi:hypothetical protein